MAMTNPMREKTIEDIRQYLLNTGLLMSTHDFDFAREQEAFKYAGYGNNQHRYLIAFESDEEEGKYYITRVYVYLGVNGLVCADFGGAPEFESSSIVEINKYIERVCN